MLDLYTVTRNTNEQFMHVLLVVHGRTQLWQIVGEYRHQRFNAPDGAAVLGISQVIDLMQWDGNIKASTAKAAIISRTLLL